MTLDKSKYFFSFYRSIEDQLLSYLKRSSNKEIFIGILGTIKGKNKRIQYEIKELIPFPNLSSTPEIMATPPEYWISIIDEKRKLLNNNLKFLGFIHSHPGKSSKKSKLDDEFGIWLLKQFGPVLMIIIGYKATLRCYLVDEDKTKIITGPVEKFKIKKQ